MPRTGQSLTSQPVSGRALLKLLKDDVAQQAAMAALLCESAGWTQLSALLSLLSADAAAGSRPELRELLRVRLASTANSHAHRHIPQSRVKSFTPALYIENLTGIPHPAQRVDAITTTHCQPKVHQAVLELIEGVFHLANCKAYKLHY